MGYMDHFDLLSVLSGLEFVLKEIGQPRNSGKFLASISTNLF